MKLGLIRCRQTEDTCPGTMDFKVIREKKCAFEGVEEDIEIIGMVTCGGCPGKRAIPRVEEMIKRGADTIALCSCITGSSPKPIGMPCPFAEQIKETIKSKFADKVKILEYTH